MKTLHSINPNEKRVNDIIRNHYPNAVIKSVERQKLGVMNWVGLIKLSNPEKEVILKLSRQPKKWGIEKEKFVIDLIRERTSVPLAEVIGYDFTRKKYSYDYLILSKIDGRILHETWNELTSKEQEELAFQAGKILAEINSIKFKDFGAIVGNRIIKTKNHKKSFLKENEQLYRIHEKLGFIPKKTLEEIKIFYKRNEDRLSEDNDPRLVHNDYHFWHIFTKKNKDGHVITGIIDFGFSQVAPRTYDLVKPDRWIFDRGENVKQKFLEGYESIEKITEKEWDRYRLYRVMFDLWFITRLVSTKQMNLANEYLKNIEEMIKTH